MTTTPDPRTATAGLGGGALYLLFPSRGTSRT
jgi:hypothetical protein